jgi:transposase InsO family protein
MGGETVVTHVAPPFTMSALRAQLTEMDTAAPSTLAVLSPERIGVDNGPPWDHCAEQRYTRLCVWLIRLGVRVSHSRPYHPQTRGKDERFHETLNRELILRLACL